MSTRQNPRIWTFVALGLTLAALACDATESSVESDGSLDDVQAFIVGACGSWNPPAAASTAELPAELSAELAGECEPASACVSFVEVGEAAGLDTVQFVATGPAERECIFDRFTIGGNVLPGEECMPQWMTGGVSVADVDDDGWPDLYMTRLGAPDHLFLNQRDGTFADVAADVGLVDCGFTNGSVFGDIDNDGDLDLFVTTLGEDRYQLWINQLRETGELRFIDEAQARGFALISDHLHAGQSVTLGDLDRDGWLDVHVNEWLRVEQLPPAGSEARSRHGSRLLHNDGSGRLEDRTAALGLELGADHQGVFAFSSTFADLDGDGWQDLAITVDWGGSRLFWNEAGEGFSDGTEAAGVNLENNAMGSAFGDLDGDGALDWFVTAIAEPGVCEWDETPPCWTAVETGNRLYRNAGGRSFVNDTARAGVTDGGWAWGTVMFDADNDGDQDLALVNGWQGRDSSGGLSHVDAPARLWINEGEATMVERGAELGFDDRGLGRGLVSFDYDRDGDLDLLVTNHAGRPKLYRNDGGNRSAWLRVALHGTISNADARGAKVRVQVEAGGPWQVREVGAASQLLGEGELIQHFGLGPEFDAGSDRVHKVEIEWPASGIVQTFDEVEAGQLLESRES